MLRLSCSDRIVAFISHILWTCPGFSGNSTWAAYRNSQEILMGESRIYQQVTRIPYVAPKWSIWWMKLSDKETHSRMWGRFFTCLCTLWLARHIEEDFYSIACVMSSDRNKMQHKYFFFHFRTLSLLRFPDPCNALSLLCNRKGNKF